MSVNERKKIGKYTISIENQKNIKKNKNRVFYVSCFSLKIITNTQKTYFHTFSYVFFVSRQILMDLYDLQRFCVENVCFCCLSVVFISFLYFLWFLM